MFMELTLSTARRSVAWTNALFAVNKALLLALAKVSSGAEEAVLQAAEELVQY